MITAYFVAINMLDISTAFMAVELGKATEVMPVASHILGWGIIPAILIKGALALAVAYLLARWGKSHLVLPLTAILTVIVAFQTATIAVL
jgi:hypothetical protein